jgi:hypothetical protein
MDLGFVCLTRVDSLRRYFFNLKAGNWRRAEAPCMHESDGLEPVRIVSIPADSRELEDSEGTRWLEVGGSSVDSNVR